MLRKNNDLIKTAQSPAHERLQAIREFTARAKLQSAAKSSLTESPFQGWTMYARYLEDEIVPEAWISCAVAALAAERFRLANQRWPQNLEELAPKWLKVVPIDPFSGAPLQMVRKGSALIIYSFGSDQKDDGGSLERTKRSQAADVGFVLHDPDQRGRLGCAVCVS